MSSRDRVSPNGDPPRPLVPMEHQDIYTMGDPIWVPHAVTMLMRSDPGRWAVQLLGLTLETDRTHGEPIVSSLPDYYKEIIL